MLQGGYNLVTLEIRTEGLLWSGSGHRKQVLRVHSTRNQRLGTWHAGMMWKCLGDVRAIRRRKMEFASKVQDKEKENLLKIRNLFLAFCIPPGLEMIWSWWLHDFLRHWSMASERCWVQNKIIQPRSDPILLEIQINWSPDACLKSQPMWLHFQLISIFFVCFIWSCTENQYWVDAMIRIFWRCFAFRLCV